jgi:hypothetical protein
MELLRQAVENHLQNPDEPEVSYRLDVLIAELSFALEAQGDTNPERTA